MTVYIESPMESTKPIVELINKFCKVPVCTKISYISMLSMNNTEITPRIPFTLASKRVN